MLNADIHEENNNFKNDKTIHIGALTDKGKTRQINEDNFFISEFDENTGIGFCIVADGMGGHNAGEVASKIAIDEIKNFINKDFKDNMTDNDIKIILKRSMEIANIIIYNKSLKNKVYSGMGTTAIVCLIYNSYLYIAHVGDSRTYLIRGADMIQITRDHSVIEELLKNGTITKEQAKTHPQKHVITRALGSEEYTEIDIYSQQYINGDIILICTDGLTTMATDLEIFDIINKYRENLQTTAENLVIIANDKGGLDNITVVLLGV